MSRVIWARVNQWRRAFPEAFDADDEFYKEFRTDEFWSSIQNSRKHRRYGAFFVRVVALLRKRNKCKTDAGRRAVMDQLEPYLERYLDNPNPPFTYENTVYEALWALASTGVEAQRKAAAGRRESD